MRNFRGEFTEFQTLVSDLGYIGHWVDGGGKYVFRSEDGAVLNWWPATGTIQVQGQEEARKKLECAISDSLAGSASTPTDLSAVEQSPSGRPVDNSSSDEAEKVFVVYGHDVTACEQLELILRRLDLNPFLLRNTGGGGLTIIEALEDEIMSPAAGKRFGIVLLTPDDMGYKQGDNSANAEPRARQNVVMEMGMLIAAFGRERVAILKKGHVVVPSDASGIIYLSFNDHVKEAAARLCQRLRGAGFQLNPDSIAEVSA